MKAAAIATYATNLSNRVSHFSEDVQTVPAKFVPNVLEIPDEVYRIIIEVSESRGRPDMAGRRKMPDSLCDYCNHSIECKSCVFGTSTQAHK